MFSDRERYYTYGILPFDINTIYFAVLIYLETYAASKFVRIEPTYLKVHFFNFHIMFFVVINLSQVINESSWERRKPFGMFWMGKDNIPLC